MARGGCRTLEAVGLMGPLFDRSARCLSGSAWPGLSAATPHPSRVHWPDAVKTALATECYRKALASSAQEAAQVWGTPQRHLE